LLLTPLMAGLPRVEEEGAMLRFGLLIPLMAGRIWCFANLC
jgi:hypothetical protein